MPKIDLTVTISVIVALCAIISPILTALINNRHHTKIKKIELRQQHYEKTVLHQRELFERYLKNAGRIIQFPQIETKKDYGEAYFAALFLAPSELREQMIAVDKEITKLNMVAASSLLADLAPKLYSSIKMQ